MSFMPKVKMDFIPSDNEEEIDSETEEENPNFNYADEDVDDPPSDIEPPIKSVITEVKLEKKDFDIDDVFEKTANIKLTKKGVPRKKRPPMSEDHKEKLKAARVKAMASRQAKAKERKEGKQLDLEEKELLKKQKIKIYKKLLQ